MAERYFQNFPLVSYTTYPAVNILERTTLLKRAYSNPNAFYSYDIKPYERPDNIADRYYKDQYMDWLLYMTNGVIDPYYGWYVDPESFDEFITKKYGSVLKARAKVKYYQNNWADDQNQISVTQYENLEAPIRKYYVPVYTNDLTMTILSYVRRRIDWTIGTNSLVSYSTTMINPTTDYIIDEIVRFYDGSQNVIGSGQVSYIGDSYVIVKCTSGDVLTTGGAYRMIGDETGATAYYSNPTVLAENIPATETYYWSPVTYYDYESQINERNKSIKVLDSSFSQQAATELKNLLK